jgi:hypothetical protein
MENIITKCCSKCGVEKNTIEFTKHKYGKDGLRSECKECSKKYKKDYYSTLKGKESIKRHNSSESAKNAKMKYRLNPENKLKEFEYNKKYRENPEVKERNKKVRKELTSTYEFKEKRKELRLTPENRLKELEYGKKYRKTPEYKKLRNEWHYKNYHSNAEYKFTCALTKHIKGIKNRQDFKDIWSDVESIYVMYGINYHIDHLIPKTWFKVSTPKNIVNNINNLQVIDAKYNLNKKNKWADPVCPEYLEIAKPYLKKNYLDKVLINPT